VQIQICAGGWNLLYGPKNKPIDIKDGQLVLAEALTFFD
jgi:hypothetical protein